MSGDDEAKTEIMDDGPIWYPSVQTVDQLRALAESGARCRVISENAIYMFYDGQWRSLAPPTKRRR